MGNECVMLSLMQMTRFVEPPFLLPPVGVMGRCVWAHLWGGRSPRATGRLQERVCYHWWRWCRDLLRLRLRLRAEEPFQLAVSDDQRRRVWVHLRLLRWWLHAVQLALPR